MKVSRELAEVIVAKFVSLTRGCLKLLTLSELVLDAACSDIQSVYCDCQVSSESVEKAEKPQKIAQSTEITRTGSRWNCMWRSPFYTACHTVCVSSSMFPHVGNCNPRGLQKVAIMNSCLPISDLLLVRAILRAVWCMHVQFLSLVGSLLVESLVVTRAC